MNKKFVFVGILVVFVLSLMVGAVSAQGGDGNGRGRGDGNRPPRDDHREIIEAIAEATGLEPQEIMQQLRDGGTLADIITENGGDVNNIIAILIGLVTDKTNQAVTDGVITQERADEILANAETRITNMLNNPLPEGGRGEGRGNRPHFEGVFLNALEDAGVTREDVRAQLEGGATLRQVLTDAGLDVASLTAEVLTNAQTRLDEQVANETITAEEAAERLSRLETRINELLDKTRPAQQQDV
ncbi:MAG: hypothetical protein KJ043_01300 [Anaerolineae bacterium]|nr:hypothetical protein [Anaerolineae bacterium]